MALQVEVPLLKKQIQFIKTKKPGVVFRAGIRSGKTRIACYKAILNAWRGRKQLIVSFSYRMLKDVIVVTLRECFQAYGLIENVDWSINLGDMIAKVNGTDILLRSADTDNGNSIRGIEACDLFIDEARQFKTNDVFLICIGRLSGCDDPQWHIITSPKGKNWIYDLEQSKGDKIERIHQRTSENCFLPKNYENELRENYTSLFQRQELEGDIVTMSAGVIEEDWLQIIDMQPKAGGVRAWDLATSIKTQADQTAGCKAQWIGNYFVIESMIHGRWSLPDVKKKIIQTAKIDGIDTIIAVENVGMQSGFIEELRREPELYPYIIKAVAPQGDKLNRALGWVSRAEQGRLKLVRSSWNQDFIDECIEFSGDMTHLHDDMIDATSLAYQVSSKVQTVSTAKVRY